MPAYWIQTHSQKTYRLDHPDPRDVCIGDIAHSLASQCRFNGHTAWPSHQEPYPRSPYSVAQHSVFVSRIVAGLVETCGDQFAEVQVYDTAMLALLGLLHDAHEAYVGDVVSPMKALLGPVWAEIELRSEEAVRLAFQLPCRPGELDIVKRADRIALATEARDLLPGGPIGWTISLPDPHPEQIAPVSAGVAREMFLNRHWELDRVFRLAGQRDGLSKVPAPQVTSTQGNG